MPGNVEMGRLALVSRYEAGINALQRMWRPLVRVFRLRSKLVGRSYNVLRVVVLVAIGLLSFLRSGSAQSQSCAYDGYVFADSTFNVNGHVCQQCVNGKWVDKASSCAE